MSAGRASLKIIHYPAQQLRTRALPVDDINDDVRSVVQRMVELMTEADGVGLAAPQVGLSWRLFVTRVPDDDGPARVYINPVVTAYGKEKTVAEEGCLSLPGINAEIERSKDVSIHAQDIDGNPIEARSDEFAARVWQHEYDHLNGVLIIDKMNTMDRLATRKALKELEASASASSSL